MAKRNIARESDAVRVQHPDGGTWGIRPLSMELAAEYVELIGREEFERDPRDGSIIFNPYTKEPLKKRAVKVTDLLNFSLQLVAFIDDFMFDDGAAVESSPANIRQLLEMMGNTEIDLDTEGKEYVAAEGQVRLSDATRGMTDEQLAEMVAKNPAVKGADLRSGKRRIRENYYLWVMRISARLTTEKNAIERKN